MHRGHWQHGTRDLPATIWASDTAETCLCICALARIRWRRSRECAAGRFLKIEPQLRPEKRTTILVILCLLAACSRGPQSNSSQPAKNPAQAASPALAPLPPCPSGGVPPVQSSSAGTGHHKVFLSWNASASAAHSNSRIGYCLYRSMKKHVAKKYPLCQQCEQVNLIPVSGTRCVDEVVLDSTTYYYVAVAIDLNRDLSPSSNEFPVVVPNAGTPKAAPDDAATYPSCRAPVPSNPAPPR